MRHEAQILSAHEGRALQVYSARTALAGCKTLADMWSHQDTDELQRLKDQLTLLQDSGVVFPEDSWPTRLLRSHPRCARTSLLGSGLVNVLPALENS